MFDARLVGQGAEIPTQKVETAFEIANRAWDAVNGLFSRIHSLEDRLLGVKPETANSKDARAAGAGVFDALRCAASDVLETVALAHHALDRIERAI